MRPWRSALILLALLIASCAPAPASPPEEAQATRTFPPTETPAPTTTSTATPLPATPELPSGLNFDIQDLALESGDGTPIYRLDPGGGWIPAQMERRILLAEGDLYLRDEESNTYHLLEGLEAEEFRDSGDYILGFDAEDRLTEAIEPISGKITRAVDGKVNLEGKLFHWKEGKLNEVIKGVRIVDINEGSEYWVAANELKNQLEKRQSFKAALSEKSYSQAEGLELTRLGKNDFDVILVDVLGAHGEAVGSKVIGQMRETGQLLIPVEELDPTQAARSAVSHFVIAPIISEGEQELTQVILANPSYDDIEFTKGLGKTLYPEGVVDVHIGYQNSQNEILYELFARETQAYLFVPELWESAYALTGYYRKPQNISMGTITREEMATAPGRLEEWIEYQVSTARYGNDQRPLSESQEEILENTLRLLKGVDPASLALILKSRTSMYFSGITRSAAGLAAETYIKIRGNYLTEAAGSTDARLWLLNVMVHEHLHASQVTGNQAPAYYFRNSNPEIWVIEMSQHILRGLGAPAWVLQSETSYFYDMLEE